MIVGSLALEVDFSRRESRSRSPFGVTNTECDGIVWGSGSCESSSGNARVENFSKATRPDNKILIWPCRPVEQMDYHRVPISISFQYGHRQMIHAWNGQRRGVDHVCHPSPKLYPNTIANLLFFHPLPRYPLPPEVVGCKRNKDRTPSFQSGTVSIPSSDIIHLIVATRKLFRRFEPTF